MDSYYGGNTFGEYSYIIDSPPPKKNNQKMRRTCGIFCSQTKHFQGNSFFQAKHFQEIIQKTDDRINLLFKKKEKSVV